MSAIRNGSGSLVTLVLTAMIIGTVPVRAAAQGWGFTVTGSLTATRDEHTATQLPNGKVLVVGGRGGAGASAELYDPVAGIFTATGMPTTLYAHTATLLPNGKVLVAGGKNNLEYYPTTRATLYDPATNQFVATGSMTTPRANHTATLLPNGKVLIAAGTSVWEGPSAASAELYDPATGTFTATGGLMEGRFNHSATLLPNGKVLIAAGLSWISWMQWRALATAELYDVASGSFTGTGTMNSVRNEFTATLLPAGKVLFTGGLLGTVNAASTASAELYDPATGAFTGTGSMATTRREHTATLLPNGSVLVAGGGASESGGYQTKSAELYDPATGTFRATASMIATRSRFTATLLSANGKVLIAAGLGGFTSEESLAGAELYGNAACQ